MYQAITALVYTVHKLKCPAALLHNHRMRNLHMCTLAIVVATCSYGIYFWQTGSNRLQPTAA